MHTKHMYFRELNANLILPVAPKIHRKNLQRIHNFPHLFITVKACKGLDLHNSPIVRRSEIQRTYLRLSEKILRLLPVIC